MALTFDHTTKLISVPQADAAPLLIQAIVDAIRAEEASERGITHPQIADATGKADLGGGVYTGITLALRSTWKLNFATGSYQATVDGGNLSEGLTRVENTGSPQVILRAAAAATLVLSSGSPAPTTGEIVTAIEAAVIPVNVKQINDTAVAGTGTDGDPWR